MNRLGSRKHWASPRSTRMPGLPPVRPDPVDPVEVGEHQDVEKLGAGSRTKGVQAFSESALEFVGSHGREATPSNRHSI
jgi:hypothetical protein